MIAVTILHVFLMILQAKECFVLKIYFLLFFQSSFLKTSKKITFICIFLE